MKKLLIFVLALVMAASLFSGCSKPPAEPQPAAPQPTPQVQPTQPPPQNAGPTNGSTAKVASSGTDIEGKFNGRIDNNTVEIQVNPEDVLAFRVTNVIDQLDDINDGDKVRFSYQTNEFGQMNITKIEKIK